MKNLIILFALNLTFLIAYSQNNDSLVTSQTDTTQSGYIIELDTALVVIKVTKVSSGWESFISKHDKVKVYIVGGSKLTGQWEIIDENTIRVNEVVVPISIIENIKYKKMSYQGKAGLGFGVGVVVGAAIFVGVVLLIWAL